ncbi:hypothetical protein Tcan_13186, partial [Toxocara canis]
LSQRLISVVWTGFCATNQVLAFNRLLDAYDADFAKKLFAGNKPWYWMIYPLIYTVVINAVPFQNHKYIYDPRWGSWAFIAIPRNHIYYMHLYNNVSTFIMLAVMYSLVVYIFTKRIRGFKQVGSFQRSIYTITLLFCLTVMLSTVVYFGMQYITNVNPIWHTVAHLGWTSVHGAIFAFVFVQTVTEMRLPQKNCSE